MINPKHTAILEGLVQESKFQIPKDLNNAFDAFWKEHGANDYREFLWKMDEFNKWYPKLVSKHPDYVEYARAYLQNKAR